MRSALSTLRRRHYTNRSLDELGVEAVDSVTQASGLDPAATFGRNSLIEELHRAIHESLTERQRTAILGELNGVPSSVLAEQLGTNANAFYKLHHDARKKLKRVLNEAGFRDEDVRLEITVTSKAS